MGLLLATKTLGAAWDKRSGVADFFDRTRLKTG